MKANTSENAPKYCGTSVEPIFKIELVIVPEMETVSYL